MAMRETAERAARNPWGQWGAVILAIVGCITAYVDLQSTKAQLEVDTGVAEGVEQKADEVLAASLHDTQTRLEEVWEYCRKSSHQSKLKGVRQDEAIEDQRRIIRRTAYGIDDIRYTIQTLHPKRPVAHFEDDDIFAETIEEISEEFEPVPDTVEREPLKEPSNKLAIKKIDPYKIKALRKREKSTLQAPE